MRMVLSSLCELLFIAFFFFKQKTAYEIGLGIPAEPLFRSCHAQEQRNAAQNVYRSVEHDQKTGLTTFGQFHQHHSQDRKSGSAGMPRPISYAVFCLKKKTRRCIRGAPNLAEPPRQTHRTRP